MDKDGEQKEKMSSEDSSPRPNEEAPALDFSELTPSQFGISVQSFIPSATPKDKSRVAQLKARRKSSVGVRGSPETNSLIRFMAQQKMKPATSCQTPELVKKRSSRPRVASALRQKMASFQSLMDVEESQVCDLVPRMNGGAGGCIRKGDHPSGEGDHDQKREGDKENYPSPLSPASVKRRCLDPSESCHFVMMDAKVPVLSRSLEEQQHPQEPGKPETQTRTQAAAPSCEGAEMTRALLPFDLRSSSPPENHQQGSVFEGFAQASPSTSPPSSVNIGPLPAQLDAALAAAVKTKKKVRFGVPLSPEFFDKTLPPSTPLRKGGTPARTPTPGGGLRLRSLLKTPRPGDSDAPEAGPDPCSPSAFGASPPLVSLGRRSAGSEEGKIVFTSAAELESEAPDAEYVLDAQPLNLDAAFYEESCSQTQTGFENDPSTFAPAEEQGAEPETQPEAPVQAPAQRGKKRKKQSEEVGPVRKSSRSAAKLTCEKMKASAAARKWNKEVDRSLYSSRAYASKHPTLSPIKERRSFAVQPASGADSESRTASEPAATGGPPDDPGTCCRCGPEIAMGTDEKQAGLEREKSSDAVGVQLNVTAGERRDENCEDPEAPREPPPSEAGPEQGPVDPTLGQAPEGTSEGPVAPREASSPRPPSADSSDEDRQRRARRGRRRSHDVDADQKDQRRVPTPASETPEAGGAAGLDLAPWQTDFNLEDVFKPVAARGRHLVRRSLRNLSGSEESSAGLAWLPHTSPESIRTSRRRTRGRSLSAAPPPLSEDAP